MDTRIQQVLELFMQPAFLVRDDIVTWCNGAARGILAEGMPISALLENETALFSHWSRDGVLQIPLIICGVEYNASVCATQDGDLFVASRRSRELNMTAATVVSASASLRKPLHMMVSAADELFGLLEAAPEDASVAASQLNRSIYQLVRLCGQMSDGGQLLLHCKEAHREPTDLLRFLDDFILNARPLVESAGVQLVYTPPAASVHGDVDHALLERALYNLISNALNYTPRGGTITVSAQKQEHLLLLCVSDNGEGIEQGTMSTLFERFSVFPLGDSRRGIGLGLPMVREIARLHDGTMMVDANPGGGTRVTFSLSLDPAALTLRSHTVRYDYCGNFHHGLVELSDVLDTRMFNPSEIQ